MPSIPDTESQTLILKLQQIGDGVGILLPDDALARMNLNVGDALHLTSHADGSLILSFIDSHYARTMRISDQVMDEYRDTFAALAK